MALKKDIYLPPGVTPRDDFNNKKEEFSRGTVRYPSKDFHSEFYAICEKARVSMNEVLVGFASDFINKNKHLLEKGKK